MKNNELKNVVNKLNLKDESKLKIIRRATACKNEKERIYMSKKKTGALILAASLALGVVAYAASGIISTWHSSSSSKPEYTELPTSQEVIDDIGYSPVLIEEFATGYAFENASIVKNTLKDDAGKKVENFKSIDLRYQRNGSYIYLSADKYASQREDIGDEVKNIDGTAIYYSMYMNKIVPGNYKLTDEDKKAEENGELVFTYGAKKVSIIKVESLKFEKDGIRYNLMQMDGTASVDELISMAEEIIKG